MSDQELTPRATRRGHPPASASKASVDKKTPKQQRSAKKVIDSGRKRKEDEESDSEAEVGPSRGRSTRKRKREEEKKKEAVVTPANSDEEVQIVRIVTPRPVSRPTTRKGCKVVYDGDNEEEEEEEEERRRPVKTKKAAPAQSTRKGRKKAVEEEEEEEEQAHSHDGSVRTVTPLFYVSTSTSPMDMFLLDEKESDLEILSDSDRPTSSKAPVRSEMEKEKEMDTKLTRSGRAAGRAEAAVEEEEEEERGNRMASLGRKGKKTAEEEKEPEKVMKGKRPASRPTTRNVVSDDEEEEEEEEEPVKTKKRRILEEDEEEQLLKKLVDGGRVSDYSGDEDGEIQPRLDVTVLDNDVFIEELGKFFFNSRTGGPKNVAVTMNRYDGRNKPKPDDKVAEYSVIFRAVCGHKKISTVVEAKEVINFGISCSSLMKGSNLERRVVKKGEYEKKGNKPTDSGEETA